MRRFACAYEPAREYILSWFVIDESDLMRAVANVRQGGINLSRSCEFAIPGRYGDPMRAEGGGRNDVLATGQSRCGHGSRIFEELVLGSACDDAAASEHEQVGTKTECLFHVVRDEDDR